MADLRCTRCGTEASYADANIADVRETCEETREVVDARGNVRTSTVSTEHEWVAIRSRGDA